MAADMRSPPAFVDVIPAADRAHLLSLPAVAAQEWAIARADEYQKVISALRSFHNSLAPIHLVLPPEMLSEVLSHCWQGRRSLGLMLVCRYWHSVILKTSGFWADAAGDESLIDVNASTTDQEMATIKTVLKRASSRPLHLIIKGLNRTVVSALQATQLVQLEVSFRHPSQLDLLRDTLQSPGYPHLEALGVVVPLYRRYFTDGFFTGAWSPEYAESFRARCADPQRAAAFNTPRLHTLHVPISIFQGFTFPALRTAHLTSPVFPSHHTRDLIAGLRKCPDLVNLSLLMNQPMKPLEDTAREEPVHLPSLQSLAISDEFRNIVARLDLLSFPASASVRLSVARSVQDTEFDPSALTTPGGGTVAPLLSSLDTVHLSDWREAGSSSGMTVVGCTGDTERFELKWQPRVHWLEPKSCALSAAVRAHAGAVTHLSVHMSFARSQTTHYPGADSPQSDDGEGEGEGSDDSSHYGRAGTVQNHPTGADRGWDWGCDDGRVADTGGLLRAFPRLVALDVAGPCAEAVLDGLACPDEHYPHLDPDPAAPVVCGRLRTLRVAFPPSSVWRPSGSGSGSETGSGTGPAAVAALGMRQVRAVRAAAGGRIALLARTLAAREAHGAVRLERLEWGEGVWDEGMRTTSTGSRAARGNAVYVPDLSEFGSSRLGELVDGPVVYLGMPCNVPERTV
ncbi:uncharacterized protein BXZ73DRAFT_106579 [Epithele typhae]|uniref:uncharacterized protein n=1 Tax=Epithele typhae TaxID=378194 RepID=UPI002007DC24|nr:uncharacterized protein BXZ73DRAFT_106579 [Epithele typhae]KAH9914506.1 hypothetical protein BXZ73DRAFT_106579 [Epithele typhae]